jgi:hypothetical protein
LSDIVAEAMVRPRPIAGAPMASWFVPPVAVPALAALGIVIRALLQ